MYYRWQVRGYRKASLTRQLVRRFERVVTVVQEWLEGEDNPAAEILGYGFVALTFLYMVGQVVRCFV